MFSISGKVHVFASLFISFNFQLVVHRDSQVHKSVGHFFVVVAFLYYHWVYPSDRDRVICLFLKIHENFVSYSLGRTLVRGVNHNFLHNYQWIIRTTQSCLVIYSLCANLQHSLIICLIILSLSPHDDGLPLDFVWQQVSSSRLKSPGLFSKFWPFSIML